MSKSNKSYTIEIHYPDNEEEMLCIRKRLGEAYAEFLREYIDTLAVSQEEKDMLYYKTLQKLNSHT